MIHCVLVLQKSYQVYRAEDMRVASVKKTKRLLLERIMLSLVFNSKVFFQILYFCEKQMAKKYTN